MDNLQKVKSLYKSGRFQCDLFFYSKLQQIANHLNLYEYIPSISKNKHIVLNTSQLTKKHLKALEQQDNQQKALEIIHEINRHVSQIDTKFVKNIIQEIQTMNGKGYQDLLISYVKAQPYKKLYSQTFDRILNSLHDPKFRLQQLLTIGIFIVKNTDKVQNFITIYANVLQNGINQLKKFKQNYQFIIHNPQVQQHPKIYHYLHGSKIIIGCLVKFNQIYKLLSGDNKFGLKLVALKKDIELSLNNYQNKNKKQQNNNGNGNGNNGNNGNINGVNNRPIKQFKKFLLNGQKYENVCSLCLIKSANGDHEQCRNTIKLLYQQKTTQQK